MPDPLGVRISRARKKLADTKKWLRHGIERRKNTNDPEKKKARAEVVKKLKDAVKRIAARLKELLSQKPKPNFNGHPSNVSAAIKEVIVEANKRGLYVTATTDGTHAPGSWHYQHRAVDLAAPMTSEGIARMRAFHIFAAKKWPNALEIFGPGTFYIKNGAIYEGQFPNHGNHNHVAL